MVTMMLKIVITLVVTMMLRLVIRLVVIYR